MKEGESLCISLLFEYGTCKTLQFFYVHNSTVVYHHSTVTICVCMQVGTDFVVKEANRNQICQHPTNILIMIQ